MINGFEEETKPLTDEEKEFIPFFVRCLAKRVGKKNAVTNQSIREGFARHKVKITDSRVRKIINHIRINDLVPKLCANSRGYYVAGNSIELIDYIDGLRSRIKAQSAVLKQLEKRL